MVEVTKDFGVQALDPIEHYKSILTNKHSSDLLCFIDISTAMVLSKAPRYADIMLKHPYYNIRATYASVTENIDHQTILSNDEDWRVRAGLATNRHLSKEISEKLRKDPKEQIIMVLKARTDL